MKRVSASCGQNPLSEHWDGASAIHSAELRSGAAIVRWRVKTTCRVRSFTCTSTSVPLITTVDAMTSPGWIFTFRLTESAGTSSYQM